MRDHAAAARLHLLHVRHDLVEHRVVRRDEHHRHVLVDQRDRPVLHLRRRIALGVDVADLLELERALERGREVVAAAEVQEVRRVLELLGDLLDLAARGRGSAGSAPAAPPAPARSRGPRTTDMLRSRASLSVSSASAITWLVNAFVRRDADLRAGVQVDAAVVLARDRRADHVHDAERLARRGASPRASPPACPPSRPTARSRCTASCRVTIGFR